MTYPCPFLWLDQGAPYGVVVAPEMRPACLIGERDKSGCYPLVMLDTGDMVTEEAKNLRLNHDAPGVAAAVAGVLLYALTGEIASGKTNYPSVNIIGSTLVITGRKNRVTFSKLESVLPSRGVRAVSPTLRLSSVRLAVASAMDDYAAGRLVVSWW